MILERGYRKWREKRLDYQRDVLRETVRIAYTQTFMTKTLMGEYDVTDLMEAIIDRAIVMDAFITKENRVTT